MSGCRQADAASFGLSVTFQGYGVVHPGILFHAVLEETESKSTQEIVRIDTLSAEQSEFSIGKSEALQRQKSYNLFYFADVNRNGRCDEEDHAWVDPINTVTKDTRLVVKHTPVFNFTGCAALNR